LIYGGDFPQANGQDNPSASPNGFGNCDLAIDLGTQDPSNNAQDLLLSSGSNRRSAQWQERHLRSRRGFHATRAIYLLQSN
jgi:hypothetical protein